MPSLEPTGNFVLHEKKFDLTRCPQKDPTIALTNESDITFGDMHASAPYFLTKLITNGVVKEIPDTTYQRFCQLVKIPADKITKPEIEEYFKIIDSLEVSTTPTVREIGDTKADRGENDIFILAIEKKLREAKVRLRNTLSNHDGLFYQYYDSIINNPEKFKEIFDNGEVVESSGSDFYSIWGYSNRTILFLNKSIFPFDIWRYKQSISSNNMAILLKRGVITREEVVNMVEEGCKPSLVAIDYTLSPDRQTINLHGHAGIDLKVIAAMARHEKIQVEYDDSTAENLALTIDKINNKFQTYLKTNSLTDLYTPAYESGSDAFSINKEKNPFEFAMWNRNYSLLARPVEYKGYRIFYTHGHDSQDPCGFEQGVNTLNDATGRPGNDSGVSTDVICHRCVRPQLNTGTEIKKEPIKTALQPEKSLNIASPVAANAVSHNPKQKELTVKLENFLEELRKKNKNPSKRLLFIMRLVAYTDMDEGDDKTKFVQDDVKRFYRACTESSRSFLPANYDIDNLLYVIKESRKKSFQDFTIPNFDASKDGSKEEEEIFALVKPQQSINKEDELAAKLTSYLEQLKKGEKNPSVFLSFATQAPILDMDAEPLQKYLKNAFEKNYQRYIDSQMKQWSDMSIETLRSLLESSSQNRNSSALSTIKVNIEKDGSKEEEEIIKLINELKVQTSKSNLDKGFWKKNDKEEAKTEMLQEEGNNLNLQ